MSKYTTGELARLCGVTVRTVQYYDTRGILVPEELTEGGRRLYSDADLKKLQVICYLRNLDMSIDSIARLLSEEHPEHVLELMIAQQEQALRQEIDEKQEKLAGLKALRSSLHGSAAFSLESIGDMAVLMRSRKDLKKVHRKMLLMGLPITIAEIAAIVILAVTGCWIPLAVWAALAVPAGIWISRFYMNAVIYICPECHELFKPGKREMLFAPHTPNTRVLTCPHCGHHGFCVETCPADEA